MKPSAEQMVEALPQRAKQARISGGAILSCLVTAGKMRRACKVLDETQGRLRVRTTLRIRRAALRLSRHFRIRPPLRDGQPRYDIRVRIPVYWEIFRRLDLIAQHQRDVVRHGGDDSIHGIGRIDRLSGLVSASERSISERKMAGDFELSPSSLWNAVLRASAARRRKSLLSWAIRANPLIAAYD